MSKPFMNEEMTVKQVERMETFYNYVIIFGFIVIIAAGVIAGYEFWGAKLFCKSVDGEYLLHLFPFPVAHYCNGEKISKYSDGWDFESYRDLTIPITLP